ncbi:porin [Paraburkholderia sp. HP33-1]|uniref:porin n=1 Tax=Paraburkholderia sp. HP33-1 TaxID=2883243 RepID=UPI001F16AC45|nr:porin [Paraburkholderia sp. HP33-1]
MKCNGAIQFAILLIILFAAGTSYAQSSVTLYGIVDSGLQFTNKTFDAQGRDSSGKTLALIDSGLLPSQFGLTGTEDLGNGVKATFKLESGISVANGGFNDSNGHLFGRQAWVDLSGNFGDFKAGLQFSSFFNAIFATDPRSYSNFGSALVVYADNVIATGAFNANAISYTSPDLYGFQGSVMLALGGEAGNFQAGRQCSASLRYTNGSLLINAAFYDGNAGGTVNTPLPTTLEFVGREIGASYSFGKLSASAAVVNYNVANSFNNYVYSLGLQFQATHQLALDAGVYLTTDQNDHANRSVMGAIGTRYFLSKRTTLYGQLGAVHNRGSMNSGLSVSGALYGVSGTTIGFDIGVSHLF